MTRINKKIIKISLIVLTTLIIILIALYFCLSQGILSRFILALSRTGESTSVPNISGTVTDIRITTVARDISKMPGMSFVEYFQDRTFLQIYYGYQLDGDWHDYPAENYDLRRLKSSDCGYDAVSSNHIVKIGQYVLIAFTSYRDLTVTDSLNSEVVAMTEYYTSGNDVTSDSAKYGQIIENTLEGNIFNYEYEITSGFDKWYYIILEYDDIPEDYVVSYSLGDSETPPVYTYDDIMEALNRE